MKWLRLYLRIEVSRNFEYLDGAMSAFYAGQKVNQAKKLKTQIETSEYCHNKSKYKTQ